METTEGAVGIVSTQEEDRIGLQVFTAKIKKATQSNMVSGLISLRRSIPGWPSVYAVGSRPDERLWGRAYPLPNP